MGKKKVKPIKLITLDTETYNGLIGDLKRIAIYDGKKVYYGYKFEDIEPILDNYNNAGYSVEIYIHNMEFDLRKIPIVFNKDRIVWNQSLIINGKVAKIQNKNYCFHDSFKILPMGLSKISKGFGVEHGKLDLWEEVEKRYPGEYKDIVDFLDRCDIDNELYLEYLGYDVMSLYEVLEKLMEISGLTEHEFVKCVSTSSLSRYIFKNGYKGVQFQNPLSSRTDYEYLCSYKWQYNLEVEEFLRETYAGGRVEVFIPRLEVPGFHYDINSLYPFVMSMGGKNCKGEYPIGKPKYTESPDIAKHYYEQWKEDGNGLGFVNCRVFIPKQPIPPLPVQMGKLTFPCGEVYGSWTYEELEYAEKECGVQILEYFACCHFDMTYAVFKNFVSTFSQMKEQASRDGNEPLRTFSKLVQNVGYGYTGMRRDDKTSLAPFEDFHKYTDIKYADEELGFIEIPTEVNSEYIQVQVASYVTSRARLVLLKGLRDVINRGGRVYYCDTDSIVSDIPLSDEIVHPEKLGYYKLEGEPIKALFLRPKVYTELFENESPTIKFKGVSRETQATLDFDFYSHLYEELEKGEKEYEIVEKNKLLLRSIMYMEKNDLEPNYYETRDKKMNFITVEKRVMNYKENYTEPLFFETLEAFENFSFKPMKKEVAFNMKKGVTI